MLNTARAACQAPCPLSSLSKALFVYLLHRRQIKHEIGLMVGAGVLHSCDKGSTSWFHPDNLIASIAMMSVQ